MASLCKGGCGFYGGTWEGFCSRCKVIAAGAGAPSKAPIESASSSLTHLAALASESGGRIVVSELPLQTDAAHSAIASNQCSWVAHEFVLRGEALVATARSGGEAAFRATYGEALDRGSNARRLKGSAALSMGENVDHGAVREHARRAGLTSLGEPFCAVGSVVKLEAMRAMASAAGALGALAFAQVDPRRPGVDNCPEGLSAFGTGLAALAPGGSALVCRNGKSLAVLRNAHEGGEAFLILDSHCSEAALLPLPAAFKYVCEEGGGTVPELTWVFANSGSAQNATAVVATTAAAAEAAPDSAAAAAQPIPP
jgi:hypothetical protein